MYTWYDPNYVPDDPLAELEGLKLKVSRLQREQMDLEQRFEKLTEELLRKRIIT